jgi:putative FmdB family regulatory protein
MVFDMPIFEYSCSDCGSGFEIMHVSSASYDNISCPSCNGSNVGKKFSTFAVSAQTSAGAMPMCETTGGCQTPNIPGCKSGTCGLV